MVVLAIHWDIEGARISQLVDVTHFWAPRADSPYSFSWFGGKRNERPPLLVVYEEFGWSVIFVAILTHSDEGKPAEDDWLILGCGEAVVGMQVR